MSQPPLNRHPGTHNSSSAHNSSSVLRRLCAMTYDAILTSALLIFIGGLYVGITRLLLGSVPESTVILQLTLLPCLIMGSFCFYAYFWRSSGQTLGLQTWRLQLISISDNTGTATTAPAAITWRQCGIRFVVAWLSFCCGGLGLLWALFHPKKRSWQDLASGTCVVDVRQS